MQAWCQKTKATLVVMFIGCGDAWNVGILREIICITIFMAMRGNWLDCIEWRWKPAISYLECGNNKGDPRAIGPGVDGMLDDEAVAAASGCKKLRLWSIRSWCCVKHRVSNSGNASIRSCELNTSVRTGVGHQQFVAWSMFLI